MRVKLEDRRRVRIPDLLDRTLVVRCAPSQPGPRRRLREHRAARLSKLVPPNQQARLAMSVDLLTFDNPVFHAYVLAACIMLLKLMLQPWMTVARMTRAAGGYRSPEDARRSRLNPNPRPDQLAVDEYVDRSRRIHLNDLESIPGFLIAGLLFVLASPPLLLAQILLWTYVISRALHFAAYLTAQLHDVRAFFWTWGALSVLVMIGYTLVHAIRLL
jgi:glutathione S-transferase